MMRSYKTLSCLLAILLVCCATVPCRGATCEDGLCQEENTIAEEGDFSDTIGRMAKLPLNMLSPFESLPEENMADWPWDPKFVCTPVEARPTPTDVHFVRPADIKVVMAIGDSITAGFVEDFKTILDGLREYRGAAFDIGGQAGRITIPNFLKFYQPNLKGFSVGTLLLPIRLPYYSHLNAATSGAMAFELLSQVDYLVTQLPKNHVDVKNDWKLLTLFIGSNDICRACDIPLLLKEKEFHLLERLDIVQDVPEMDVRLLVDMNDIQRRADKYEKHVQSALERLHENVPRVIVNLVVMLNLTELAAVGGDSLYCTSYHLLECPCPTCPFSPAARLSTQLLTQEINRRLEKLQNEWAAKKLKEFAVVVQPFLEKTNIPDKSFLSPFDCFHPSAKAHAALAIGLWNNMIEPIGSKRRVLNPGDCVICPTNDTLIYVPD